MPFRTTATRISRSRSAASSRRTYDVAHEIGNVVIDNVDITGSYAKVLFYVQGYTGMDGLDFDQRPGIVGPRPCRLGLRVLHRRDRRASCDLRHGERGAGVDDIIDLTNVTVSNDIVINVGPTIRSIR